MEVHKRKINEGEVKWRRIGSRCMLLLKTRSVEALMSAFCDSLEEMLARVIRKTT